MYGRLRPEVSTENLSEETVRGREREVTMTRKRGVFEKTSGSGIWFIRFVDGRGRYRREKAGIYSFAIKLLDKRRGEAVQGKNSQRRCAVNSWLFPRLRRTRSSTLALTSDQGRMMNRE